MVIRAVILACLLVSLTACRDESEPKFGEPTTPPPTVAATAPASASPAPTPTTSPDPRQPYRDFIDHYVAAISGSLSTGDPAPWLAMSDPACQNCAGIADALRDAYAGGGRIEDARWSVLRASYRDTGDLGQVWRISIKTARERWLDGQGKEVKIVKAGRLEFGMAIQTIRGQLSVREISRVEAST